VPGSRRADLGFGYADGGSREQPVTQRITDDKDFTHRRTQSFA